MGLVQRTEALGEFEMSSNFDELMALGAVSIALFTMGPGPLLHTEQSPLVSLQEGDTGFDLELPSQ